MEVKSLAQLHKGEKGRIVAIHPGESALRLMEIGLVIGADIELLATSPFGDPIAVKLDDFSVSLRKEDAKQIEVHITNK
jgi:ferrous iron transport protein A